MPGVLQVEALAQAAAILGIESLELGGTGKLVYFMGIDWAKFRAPVEPGCLLDLHVEFTQNAAGSASSRAPPAWRARPPATASSPR
jgi:3-hydroxymyristoyl/3-hydroxydecanoyl-(acyl carrier protein) dehydratase